MSSSIEKAAQRLEQLRQAGVDIPASAPAAAPVAAAPASTPVAVPAPPVPAEPVATSKSIHIDLAHLSARGFVTPHAPRSALADQYRVVKRPLIANATGKGAAPIDNGNLIMVTSSLPGEGKSYTSINLAMSIAMELDYTVMLVDADVAKPSVMKALGLQSAPGLLDLLLDDSMQMSDVLLRTNIDKLSILPSGTPHPRATELLASDAMTRLVADMGSRYKDRIIIFDSPPLLLTTESRVLATHMGQIVVVVQAEKTLRSQVKHALATIEACPVKMVLLNQARAGGQETYGYGYGYGYGHTEAAKQEVAA